jgi:hypothetical protein
MATHLGDHQDEFVVARFENMCSFGSNPSLCGELVQVQALGRFLGKPCFIINVTYDRTGLETLDSADVGGTED